MVKRIGNFTARNLIILYVLIYTIMPIVQRLTSMYLSTYFYMGLVVVLTVLVLVMDGTQNLSIYLTFILPFLLFQLLGVYSPKEDWLLWGYNVLLFVLPVIIGLYLTDELSRMKSIYKMVLVFALIITMITTIIGCIQNPNAARILATIKSSQDADAIRFDMKNIGGYFFVYYMVLLYPVLILAYKTRRIRLLPTIIITLLILATVIYSEYTTALLLFIMTSFLFLTQRSLSYKGIVVISCFAVVFLLFFTNVVADFLRWLADVIGSETIADRLNALAGGTTGLEASEDNRIELYHMSLNAFGGSPIFGTLFEGRRHDGGHSFILDNLAQFGILGAGLMYFMYHRIFRRFFLPFKDKPGFGYVVWTFIQAIILSTVNTGMWLEVLCLFCPILFYWVYGVEIETKEVKDEATVDSKLAAGTSG